MLSLLGVACTDPVQPIAERPRVLPPGFQPVSAPADNQPTPERIMLGKLLFHDPRLSADLSVSCASCHQADYAFADPRPVSVGVYGRVGQRNAPSLVNIGYHPALMREGAVPTLEMQVLVPIQEHAEFDMNILRVADRLAKDSSIQERSLRAYGRPIDPYVITRAIAAYERTLVSSNARYDLSQQLKDSSILTLQERRGMELFMSSSTSCSECHAPPHFTTYGFANNGLSEEREDRGKARVTGKDADVGVFKIPSLRNVAVTAPYLHHGSLRTLEQVVQLYNAGGVGHRNQDPRIRPLRLSEQEITELVAFLRCLTDADVASSPALRP